MKRRRRINSRKSGIAFSKAKGRGKVKVHKVYKIHRGGEFR